jgi:hypothetical protein
MSYEGTNLFICARGHYHSQNCYASDLDGDTPCPNCGAPIIWFCSVDQTNHAGIWPGLEVFRPAQIDQCPCCGHRKVIAEIIYKIPDNVGYIRPGSTPKVPVEPCEFKVYPHYEEEPRFFETIKEATDFLNAEEDRMDEERRNMERGIWPK